MFAQKTSDFIGRFDSKSERKVAESIISLSREQKIDAVIAHPQIGGIYADFLIQAGSDAPTYSKGELVIVEYDGLGIDRTNGLEGKLERYGAIRRHGLNVEWIFDTKKQLVEEQLFSEGPAKRVRKTMYCSNCGFEKQIIVLTSQDVDPEIEEEFMSCPKKCKD